MANRGRGMVLLEVGAELRTTGYTPDGGLKHRDEESVGILTQERERGSPWVEHRLSVPW